MRIGHFFVDRPIFAAVVSIVTVVVGFVAYLNLPVAQYPEIAPPSIRVNAVYSGANAETIAETVAAPLEQAINGVENMLYMSSQSTGDGSLSINVVFALGTDLDVAQVQVQNRVNSAEPRLPEEVRRIGIQVNKAASDFLMVLHLFSPDQSLDEIYVSNYLTLNVKDIITRIKGVGETFVFGARELSVRVWLDPQKLAAYGMGANDVLASLREQNVQVSGGALGQTPSPANTNFRIIVSTQGRFQTAEQFQNIILKSGEQGQLLRLKDVARVELGAKEYSTNSYLDGQFAVGMGINQRPGTNALEAAEEIKSTMEELKKSFPVGLSYEIAYNPTEFVSSSIKAVQETIFEAIILVVIVVLIFLQSFRAALIPILTIPVSLIGTFAVMSVFGFSFNMLTLFGLILAIGIVVDDAIVVVENVERNIANGMTPRQAAHRTMDEVGTAVIAIAVVLSAVFIPTAFVPGISGQFYKQFAITIAAATVLSAINSLSLSPALAALLLRPHAHHAEKKRGLLRRLGDGFNTRFDRLSHGYGRGVIYAVGHRSMFLLIYVGLIVATILMWGRVPGGFIPASDQNYGIVVMQLPDGASLQRSDDVARRAEKILRDVPGVSHVVGIAGFSAATFTPASNAATAFITFKPFEERLPKGQTVDYIVSEASKRLFAIEEAFILPIKPPSVRGLGNGGGFNMQVQDRGGMGLAELEKAAQALIARASQMPQLTGVFTTFSLRTPQLYLDIDRDKAQILGVPIGSIFQSLQVLIGSAYANDFTAYGRSFQVNVQADSAFRLQREDLLRIKVQSRTGALVPLGTLVQVKDSTGAFAVTRHNIYPAISVQGNAVPGVSSAQALTLMEQAAAETLPPGISYEWTEIALQERSAGNSAIYIFALAVLFVFLALAAQYESWSLPLAIVLIVPLAVLAALCGVWLRGMDNNILTQVGFIVLIGLAAKNAILIVEFARQHEDEGHPVIQAVIEACRQRLRPIIMTSLAFTLGVVPLAIATGAGGELRQAIGTAVVFGMMGVTILGLILTPVFYVVVRLMSERLERLRRTKRPGHPPAGY
jgi:hydrophobe/amphiphile efflux-1 (HAE1) family protein